jgi:UDP-glucuronate decarboxylase
MAIARRANGMAHRDRIVSLVAGGGGFLGSHLCEALAAAGHRVICIDSFLTGAAENLAGVAGTPAFDLVEQDICTPIRIPGRIDRVFNLACAASPPRYQADPVHTMLTCVVGTKNLLDLAESKGARFLQASTSEIYGDPERHPQNESYLGHVNCTGPRACYDEGKRAAEAMCFDFLRAGRADVRVARIFNTYGPRMQPDDGRIVSNLVAQGLGGRAMTIFGHGEQTRSFCYVADLVRGLRALMDRGRPPEGPINLGNPEECTINALARLIAELAGVPLRVQRKPMPQDDPQRRRPDITRAAAELGWHPEIGLREGLGETIEWFRSRLAALSAVPAAEELRLAGE